MRNPTPQELAELNAAPQSTDDSNSSGVPSSSELAELNAASQPSSSTPFLPTTWGATKALGAGIGSGLQTLTRSGLNVLQNLGQAENSLPGGLQTNTPQKFNSLVNPYLNTDLMAKMNVPNTLLNRSIAGVGKEAIPITAAIMSGGGSLPEILSGMGTQAVLGAGLHPNNALSDAAWSAALQGAGSVAPAIVNNSFVKNAVQSSMDRLQPFLNGFKDAAQKGYDVLESMGSKKIVDPIIPNAKSAFPTINNPQEVADYLQSVKGEQGANSDVLKESQDALAPDYKTAIESKFDPQTLDAFKSISKGGNAFAQFNKFLENPSAQQAGIFKRALSAARMFKNADQDAIYTNMKDQLNDNVIIPGISKNGSKADIEKYGNADQNYRQFKQFTNNDPMMDNFVNGHIDAADILPQQYFKMLQGAKINGAFSSVPSGVKNVPLEEYNSLKSIFNNPNYENALHKHYLARLTAGITPAVKFGALGYQGYQNQ